MNAWQLKWLHIGTKPFEGRSSIAVDLDTNPSANAAVSNEVRGHGTLVVRTGAASLQTYISAAQARAFAAGLIAAAESLEAQAHDAAPGDAGAAL